MPKTKPTYAESLAKITSAENAVKQALARKRELIEQSKLIAYDEIAQLYGAEGQALIDAVTQEHDLIGKLTASGMTYEQIAELADDSNADAIKFYDKDDDADSDGDEDETDGQLSFDDEKKNPYAD